MGVDMLHTIRNYGLWWTSEGTDSPSSCSHLSLLVSLRWIRSEPSRVFSLAM